MARLIISTFFVATVLFSGAFGLAGLLPSQSPVSVVRSSMGVCRGQVNQQVSQWTANIQADASLTPECKACCEAAASRIRSDTLQKLNENEEGLIQGLQGIVSALVTSIVVILQQVNAIVNNILSGLLIDLDNAKQQCILQTATVAPPCSVCNN